jgi:hypothetical protein
MTKRNPRYDGLHVFKPDLDKLCRGDVILTRNAESASFKGKAQSDVIAKATGGSFSHALLYTVAPTLIEAISDGVSNISAQNCFVHDLKHVRVLRYHDQRVAGAAASEAMKFFAKGYSVRAAIRSAFPGTSVPDPGDDGIFCSALVAMVFRAAGAPEFASIDPMKTTPATLENLKGFADVTAQAFERILSPSNIEDMSALDGDRRVSPFAGQAKLLNSYYVKLSHPIDDLIAAHPPLAEFEPTTFFGCLPFINHICAAANRFPPDVEADKLRAQVKLIDDLAFELLSEGKLQEMEKAAEAIEDETMRYSLEQSLESDPDVDLNDTLRMIKATRDQIASRSSILNDPETPPGLSRAWDKWTEITEENLRYFDKRLRSLNKILARVFPSARGSE